MSSFMNISDVLNALHEIAVWPVQVSLPGMDVVYVGLS